MGEAVSRMCFGLSQFPPMPKRFDMKRLRGPGSSVFRMNDTAEEVGTWSEVGTGGENAHTEQGGVEGTDDDA